MGAVQGLEQGDESGFRSVAEDPKYKHDDKKIRAFLWHFDSLFPNNHLLPPWFDEVDYLEEAEEFKKIIYDSKNEREIQNYIKNDRKWFIPGSIFFDYNFGHHDAYLFPEQTLGGLFKVDYARLD